jgi:hypothetical protein
MNLAQRVRTSLDNPNSLSTIGLNTLLQELAQQKETDALVRIWDIRNGRPISEQTWKDIERLHALGKGNIPNGTIVIPQDRIRLAPARRLHKICKGRIISYRSNAALQHLQKAIEYVTTHSDFQHMERSLQVKTLQKDLDIDNAAARGLITKLKIKKLI